MSDSVTTAPSTFVRRRALSLGIAAMFLLTWPIDLAHSGRLPLQPPFIVYLFLGWGFVIAAVAMTWLTGGRGAVVTLLKRFLIWRVGWAWYAALLIPPAIMGGAVLANAWYTAQTIDFSTVFAHRIFGASADLPMFIVSFLLVDAISNGEEIGWRGYVLPRLQARHNALVASLLLGVVWALWHFPKFLAPDNTTPFGPFVVKIIAEAVLFTWIYNNTRGSLLMTTLFHAASNTAGVFLPIANTVVGSNVTTLLFQTALDVTAAIIVVAVAGPTNLSRSLSRQTQI
ncbi:MAG TPA: type II CAAX endopeptidase family protein [Pseudomonadales bacterium]|nr:type II CAAX endopeptidase family protein [Pseudomonadales bacterium]